VRCISTDLSDVVEFSRSNRIAAKHCKVEDLNKAGRPLYRARWCLPVYDATHIQFFGEAAGVSELDEAVSQIQVRSLN